MSSHLYQKHKEKQSALFQEKKNISKFKSKCLVSIKEKRHSAPQLNTEHHFWSLNTLTERQWGNVWGVFFLTLLSPSLSTIFVFNHKRVEALGSLKHRAVSTTSLWWHMARKLAWIHPSLQTRFLYLQNSHGRTRLRSRIIFYFQVAKLSPNKLRYFTAIYSTYQAASNFNPKSSSPLVIPKLTPTAFRKNISDWETWWNRALGSNPTRLFLAAGRDPPPGLPVVPTVRKDSPWEATPFLCTWRAGIAPKNSNRFADLSQWRKFWNLLFIMHKTNSVHLKATEHPAHLIGLFIPFGFDHVCTICYWNWYQVNSCQQQLSHKKLFWWHHLTPSVTSPQSCTSSPPALIAPHSLQDILFILKCLSLLTYRNDCSLFSSKCFLQ